MLNIIRHKKIFLTISAVLVIASIAVIFIFGFRYGIDFVGGTLWEIQFEDVTIDKQEIENFLSDNLEHEGALATKTGESGRYLLRLPVISEEEHRAFLLAINEDLGEVQELRFETIGSAVGRELRNRAITAFICVLLGISLYIAFAFRKVSHPVSSWKYGIITLITLFHDALIPAGLFAVLGEYSNAEINVNFIVAILVVVGFSVHDTIVVFDRIRENLKSGGRGEFDALVNASVNQTIARSINTSLTLFFVVAAIYFLGAPILKHFVLAIAVGTVVGTYSSIFLASPLLTMWRKK